MNKEETTMRLVHTSDQTDRPPLKLLSYVGCPYQIGDSAFRNLIPANHL